MDNPEGRWFSFHVSHKTLVILERRSVPEHLTSLDCLDSAVCLQHVLRQLEDSGEASQFLQNHCLGEVAVSKNRNQTK